MLVSCHTPGSPLPTKNLRIQDVGSTEAGKPGGPVRGAPCPVSPPGGFHMGSICTGRNLTSSFISTGEVQAQPSPHLPSEEARQVDFHTRSVLSRFLVNSCPPPSPLPLAATLSSAEASPV